jgi:hypothetical protein
VSSRASGAFFFVFNHPNVLFTIKQTTCTTGPHPTTTKGARDADVWACGEFFFFFLRVFLILTNVF